VQSDRQLTATVNKEHALMKLRFSRYAAAVLGLSLTLAACGGGTGGSTLPASPTKPQNVNATVTIYMDGTTAQSNARRPMFVSPSTNSSLLTITQHTGGATVATIITDLSSASSNCTGSSPRVCTIPISISPGTYDFNLKTYDQAPVGGAIPSGATQLANATISGQVIAANAANNITFSLSAILSGTQKPGVTCSPSACGALSYYSLPADGAAHSFTFAFTVYDVDGNPITGSVPFQTPVSVTLTETGGTGHSYLVLNGTNSGTSASITKATDTLALHYDGAGATGYTTTTNIGGTSISLSPMYVGGSGPAPSLSITKLSQTVTSAITEQGAGSGIAYSSVISGSCPQITANSASGSGASATLSVTTNTAAGTSGTCTVNVSDVNGTSVPVTLNFSVSGPISAGTPTFGGTAGASGTCASLAFTAAGQTATMTISDPLYTGGTLTASSANTGVATVSESGSGATQTAVVTAVAAGTATINLSDTTGNTLACSAGVTTTSGGVQ
jgi:hypothetical protein